MEKEMKKLFDEKKRLVRKTSEVGHKLDLMIQEKWGFHYSETDDDPIIDTLDYGTTSIPFAEFVELMDNYKKERENEEESF